jgi:hypothetical protein
MVASLTVAPLILAETRPRSSTPLFPQPKLCLLLPLPVIPIPESLSPAPPPPTQPVGFLPANLWKLVQDFNVAISGVKMEYCLWCKERWFSMGLRGETCHACFLRDKGSQSPFLMSTDNQMDPGEVLAHLLALTQVKEMIIACSYLQMVIYQYQGH